VALAGVAAKFGTKLPIYEVYTRAFAAFVQFNYIPLVLIIELNLRYFLNSLRRLPRGKQQDGRVPSANRAYNRTPGFPGFDMDNDPFSSPHKFRSFPTILNISGVPCTFTPLLTHRSTGICRQIGLRPPIARNFTYLRSMCAIIMESLCLSVEIFAERWERAC
jgi:hypothetical protein